MGDQWKLAKFEYQSDDGNTYVVGLRTDKSFLGGFFPVANNIPCDYPRQYRMRFVRGIDLATGNFAKIQVAQATNLLFTTSTLFQYLGITYQVTERVAEKRPNKY
jgi:hypothetical protein